METLFTWVHLSDLHVRARTRDDGPAPGERVLAALQYDLEAHAGDRFDALVVSGDVAWSGQREEYVAADGFLIHAARSIGLGPERVYLVAGNHDVDRGVDRFPLTAKLVSELRLGRRRFDAALEHARAREVLSSRLYAFTVFAATFGPPPANDDAPPEDLLFWSHRLEGRSGLRVRLIGLCSAFLSEGDADRGALRLGEKQVRDAAAKIAPGELVVAVSHHPARGGWLADERDIDAWLREHADVHLTGHPQDPIAEEARAGAPGSYLWVAAGASPPKRKVGYEERKLGYSIVSVLRGENGKAALRIVPRRWSPEGNRFISDERVLPKNETALMRPLRLALPAPAPARHTSVPPPPPPATGLRLSTPPPRLAPPSVPPAPAPSPTRPRLPAVNIPPAPPAVAAVNIPAPPPTPELGSPFRPVPSATPPARIAEPVRPHLPTIPGPGGPEPSRRADPPPRAVDPPPPLRPSTAPRPLIPREDPISRPQSTGLFEGPGALPAMPVPLFADRSAELDRLAQLLGDPAVASVSIAGLGGVGKTALVQHFVATRAPGTFEEGVWLDARDLPAELGRVAKRFGMRIDRPPRVDEARSFLHHIFEDRRVLLVIDNVSPGLADARAIPIPGGAARTIVTTRILTLHEDLGRGARHLRLGAWDDATCRAQLRSLVPALINVPDAALDALTRRVGGVPLAVRLLARQLLRADVTVEALQARLDRDPLGALDGGARAGETTLASTFKPAFDALGSPLRRVLVAIAACAPATRAKTVAEIAGVREDEAALALEGFAEQCLVDHAPDDERPFRLPNVVRYFLRAQPGAAEAESTHEGIYLAHVLTHGDPRTWHELEADLPEILAVVDRRVARDDTAGAWEVLKAVLGVLERRDRYAEFAASARRILRAAPPDSATAAAVGADLGLALASLGDLSGARESLSRALGVAEARGMRDTEALALGGLGRVYAMLGDLDRAVTHHRKAADLHDVLGLHKLFAIDLGNVGLCLRRQGNVGDAIEYLERALAVHEEIGEKEDRAEVLGGLGLCFRDIGEHAGAIDYFRRALAIHEQTGRRAGQATMLGNLGNTYRSQGELGEAIDHLDRALAIYEELGLPDGQGAALGNLGACYRALGEPARAREHYERALAVFRRLGLPDDHPHVRMILGQLRATEGRARG